MEKISFIGAGSRQFSAVLLKDLLLSDILDEAGISLCLMDICSESAEEAGRRTRAEAERCGRKIEISVTTDLTEALEGAKFVICSIEKKRSYFWTQDYHIPRKYGFNQVFGENGEIGGVFHALRNMKPMYHLAKEMEKLCPDAWLLNFSNPEHKLCEMLSRLTTVKVTGLCHGISMGQHQLSYILGKKEEEILSTACGMNHFTWFQSVKSREDGSDLYPLFKEKERDGDWLCDWHEIGLGRLLFRLYGLWPSPGANHYGEYLGWSKEFIAEELQFFYDPGEGEPWLSEENGPDPRFVYAIDRVQTKIPWIKKAPDPKPKARGENEPSGEAAAPIIEGMLTGEPRDIDAVNLPNQGAIPNLPDDMIVEAPAVADKNGLRLKKMEPLPPGIAEMIRRHGKAHLLLTECFKTGSKDLLVQTLLLDPLVTSYRRLIPMTEEFIRVQKDELPPLE